jgi:peroxiredoxin
MQIKIISIIFVLFSLLAGGTNLSAQVPAQKLPAFTFFRLDQQPFTEKNLPKDKMLFFVFFDPACEHCQRTITYINQHYTSFVKAAVILVSMDSLGKINAFIDRYAKQLKAQKNVVVLQDKHYQFITQFKPKKFPAMFLYAAQNQLLDYEDNEETVSRFVNAINKPLK